MSSFVDWLQHDTAGLLTLAAVSVAVLLLLIIKVKLEPFIALIVVGLPSRSSPACRSPSWSARRRSAADSLLEKGFGGILGHIAPIIGLGTVLGAIMERSGGADVLTTRLLKLFGPKGAPLAMGLTGLILGIPVFFDIGIFVLAPLVYVAAKRGGKSLVLYAMPMLAGLSMTHAFLPPHPGPVAAAGLLQVDLGWIIIMGLACGIPAWFVAASCGARWIGKRVFVEVPGRVHSRRRRRPTPPTPPLARPDRVHHPGADGADPRRARSAAWRSRRARRCCRSSPSSAHPTIALTIAVLLAHVPAGHPPRHRPRRSSAGSPGRSLKPVGMILLVVGAGAFFGAVLRATGVGQALADSMTAVGLPVILSAYLISCALRIAQGSATVAIVTTAGIIEPIVAAGRLLAGRRSR